MPCPTASKEEPPGHDSRPKDAFAPLKRRNNFGRGSVPIICMAVVCGVREAQWAGSRDRRKRAKKHRNPSKIHRSTFEEPSKNLRNITLTSRLHSASNRLSGGWQCRGWRGLGGFARLVGHARKEEADARVPARSISRAQYSIAGTALAADQNNLELFSRTAILQAAEYEEAPGFADAIFAGRSGRQPCSKRAGGPARSRAVRRPRRMGGGSTVHGPDGLALSAGPRAGRTSARCGDHGAVSRRRQIPGLGPHARLGGPVESAGRAGQVQAAHERQAAQHYLRHRGRSVALAGWRHGEGRAGGQSRPARSDWLRGTMRCRVVRPGLELHATK